MQADDIKAIVNIRKRYLDERSRIVARLAKIDRALEGASALIEVELGDDDDDEPSSDGVRAEGREREPSTKRDMAIEEAIRQVGQFVASTIRDILNAKHPEMGFDQSVVSHALRQAAEEGMLRVIEKGAGSRPTIYESRQPQLDLITKNDDDDDDDD